MSLDHFWGKACVKMASKTVKKAQRKRNVATSNTDKVQDGGAEAEEMDVLSPAMTKAIATFTANISHVIETKFDFFAKDRRHQKSCKTQPCTLGKLSRASLRRKMQMQSQRNVSRIWKKKCGLTAGASG